jgi:lysophospholipase L1-like esterase
LLRILQLLQVCGIKEDFTCAVGGARGIYSDMKFTRAIVAVFASVVVAGCGGGSVAGTPTGGTGGTGGAGGGGDPTGGTGGNAAPLLPPGATIGTYISLGDSISNMGGAGPFFEDALSQDLTAKYANMMVVHAAQTDAITDVYSDNMPSGAPLLKDQIAGLGHDYPGDVLVTITIGGNDLSAHSIAAITNTDAGFRMELDQHLSAELGELTTPGRLGSGKVYVVLANIYDFTDGMGDFATVMCGPGVNISAQATQTSFAAWNGVLASNVQKVGGALYDMYADFHGHGYNNSNADDVWYDRSSCLLPNAKGHDAIRRSIYKIVTGDTLP